MRQHLRRLAEASPVDYYLSANDGAKLWLPYRMQPVHEANDRYRKQAGKYFVDSSFSDPEIGNMDTLNKAHETGADYAMLEDVYQDHDATIERVLEGMELADDHPFDGTVVCPLQAPHTRCWRELGEPPVVAIGGLKDAADSERLSALRNLRGAAGPDVWIHGLGWGATDAIVEAVNEDPHLLDSMDSQTPSTRARSMDCWGGDEVTTPMSLHTAGYLMEDLRRLSGIADSPQPANHSLEVFAGP